MGGQLMNKEIGSTTRPVAKNLHVSLTGEVSLDDVSYLRNWVVQALEFQQTMLIDCGKATYIDTDALQFLASLRVEARSLGVPLQFQGLPGSVLANAAPRDNVLEAIRHGVGHRMTG